ncbi:PrsW family glutamic-type intramembrane protease [Polyangium sp. 15x6]|uniref:PrsW family glutamic-type intramembrane protease n=1 Tax=Polyangium sp. 15x6 TaxID=3042687 RepID=UPI00249AD442|nr:PrsW family glutamic-type intramembrane protease [Polyangium sp. 15x6]MDI3282344.1 PrsW family glutamic-type intramembrane protease [Polyangium sp. 15x6]
MNNPYGPPPGPYGHAPYPQQQRPPYPGQAPYPPQGYGAPQPPVTTEPDPDKRRRAAGLAIWILGMIAGVVLNILFTLAEIFLSKAPGQMMSAVLKGALFAFLPLGFYLFVPMVLDRYDPEPWWCLAMAFLWGAVVATGFAGMINTGVHIVFAGLFGPTVGNFVTTVMSAPLSEELFKGLAILGFFYFLRREFDGVVDGIIYATFCALGFAAVENVSYYARADMADQLGTTFFLRGVLAPWGHPLYTSMTGIGFGIARESSRTWVRWLAPIGGFFAGVFLHALWNFVPTVIPDAFVIMLLFWLLFVAMFFCIIIALVIRKGRTIRQFLRDEVLIGNLTNEELELVCSPVGRIQCTFSWRGAEGRAFIRAASRLALSKWHTARAMKGQKRTISADFIAPLRRELATLRAALLAKAPR